MSVGGISGGGGHIGAASSTRTANTLSNVGSAAFNTLVTAGSVAAGAFGGPAAAGAVNSLRGLSSGGGFGGTAGSGGEIAAATGEIASQNKANLGAAASENTAAQAFQVDLFRLQNSINMQSQTNNMITNMQKARHDAAMAAIQNVR